MNKETPIKIINIDDNNTVLKQTESFFLNSDQFYYLGGFSSVSKAEKNIKSNDLNPDVILMDVDMPKTNGIEGVKILRNYLPNTMFIMWTVKDDDDSVFLSLQAGAKGYLLKDESPSKLIDSILEVYDGGAPMSAGIATKVIDFFKPSRGRADSILTKREVEVLGKLCEGKSRDIIAQELFISELTIKDHLNNIYTKLEVHSEAQAVSKSFKNRWFLP